MTGCTAMTMSVSGYVSTGTVAKRLGLSVDTVRRQIAAGAIPAHRIGTGHARIPKEWLIRQVPRIPAPTVIRRKKT